MEVRYVEVIWTSQPHVNTVRCLVIYDFSHHLQSISQLTCKCHLLVVSTVLPEDLHKIVVEKFLNKFIRR